MKTLIDFSAVRPKGIDIKALGYDGVLRYLSTSDWKRLTIAEVKDYHANGLGVGVVFEDAANNPLGGKNSGEADAAKALAQAKALGIPDSIPIYFAVDFDTTPEQQVVIDEYLRGCASIIGADRVGVYGSFYVIERCFKNGTAKWFWQTLAWSGKQVSTHNHILQNLKSPKINGTDDNEAVDNWGGWYAEAPTPAPVQEAKSKVETELRDALKYAHGIEIGEFIDPQDQRLMAEHLRLLKDSELSARKMVDRVREAVL